MLNIENVSDENVILERKVVIIRKNEGYFGTGRRRRN